MKKILPLILGILLILLICLTFVLRTIHYHIEFGAIFWEEATFVTAYLLWVLFELRDSKREKSRGNNISDKGTFIFYSFSHGLTILTAIIPFLNFSWPQGKYVGVLLFITGVSFRIWSVITLGKYYSHLVRSIENHKIISSGPYSWIRHPAYTGMITAHLGVAVFFQSYMAFLILALCLFPSIILRIRIEEKFLLNLDGYFEYASQKKRLIPMIW